MEDFSLGGPEPGSGDDAADRAEQRKAAESRVKVPAIGLIVCGALALLGSANALSNLLISQELDVEQMFTEGRTEEEIEQMREDGVIELFERFLEVATSTGLNVSLFVVYAGLGVLLMVAGIKMTKLKGHGLARLASWLATLLCPVCCCITAIFGIWGIVVLGKPEVAECFES